LPVESARLQDLRTLGLQIVQQDGPAFCEPSCPEREDDTGLSRNVAGHPNYEPDGP
jgi:hypothetical protein